MYEIEITLSDESADNSMDSLGECSKFTEELKRVIYEFLKDKSMDIVSTKIRHYPFG